MRRTATGFVLGYHGCDVATAEKLLEGKPFQLSKNDYDWLGKGTYFWEADPIRALQWAELTASRRRTSLIPAVVGAVIDLGWCLDLTTQSSLDVIRSAYDGVVAVASALKRAVPANIDELRRPLDCTVLNFLHESMPEPKFQTVRGVFTEGAPLYPGGHILQKTHVQLAVRDLDCIRGVFRVPAIDLEM